jgi:hypothetical protein
LPQSWTSAGLPPGFHYPTDVLGGAAVGALAALLLWAPPLRRRIDALSDFIGGQWVHSGGGADATPLYGDRQLSDGVVAEQVGHCLRRVGQRVRFGDDHSGVAGLEEGGQRVQVFRGRPSS